MDAYQKEVYIQSIKDAIGDEPLTHFARRAGLSAGNLSRIRKGQVAEMETLRKIAAASTAVTYEDLLNAANPQGLHEPPPTAKTGVVRVPVVAELTCSKEELKTAPNIPGEDFFAGFFGEGDYIFFIANDNALSSKFHAGEKVIVDLSKKPKDDDAVLFRLKGSTRGMLRRLKKQGKNYVYYGDDGYLYPPAAVSQNEVEIYGVAVQAIVSL